MWMSAVALLLVANVALAVVVIVRRGAGTSEASRSCRAVDGEVLVSLAGDAEATIVVEGEGRVLVDAAPCRDGDGSPVERLAVTGDAADQHVILELPGGGEPPPGSSPASFPSIDIRLGDGEDGLTTVAGEGDDGIVSATTGVVVRR
ncbi:MAG: hypothetical protein M3245_02460, partial [Actinomycetota bacterium]|nr:hypothetical protein [Actinomycetota bacterium]